MLSGIYDWFTMSRRTYSYLPQTIDAAQVLGLQIAAARRRRRRTATDLAERAGIDTKTLRRVERGDPTVAIGTYFEVAGLVGVALFGTEPAQLPALRERLTDQLALLPSRVTTLPSEGSDDF